MATGQWQPVTVIKNCRHNSQRPRSVSGRAGWKPLSYRVDLPSTWSAAVRNAQRCSNGRCNRRHSNQSDSAAVSATVSAAAKVRAAASVMEKSIVGGSLTSAVGSINMSTHMPLPMPIHLYRHAHTQEVHSMKKKPDRRYRRSRPCVDWLRPERGPRLLCHSVHICSATRSTSALSLGPHLLCHSVHICWHKPMQMSTHTSIHPSMHTLMHMFMHTSIHKSKPQVSVSKAARRAVSRASTRRDHQCDVGVCRHVMCVSKCV